MLGTPEGAQGWPHRRAWDGLLPPKDRQRQACWVSDCLGKGTEGMATASSGAGILTHCPGPSVPGLHKGLTWGQLGPSGWVTNDPWPWRWRADQRALNSLGPHFLPWGQPVFSHTALLSPGRAGCGTQGNTSVDNDFPFPPSGVCQRSGGTSQFRTGSSIDVTTPCLLPAQSCARHLGGQG